MMDGNDVILNDVQMRPTGVGVGGLTPSAEVPSNQPKQKKFDSKNLWMALAIVFGMLAIGGVSFGVIVSLNNDKKTEELVSQVDILEERNDSLLGQLKEQIQGGGNVPTQIQPTLMSTDDYIYVGEWGIKIKKPENWRGLIAEYAFYNNSSRAMGVLEIKENSEIPTAHALILNEGTNACESLTISYDMCFSMKGDTYVVTDLPAVGTGGVSDEFRNFVLDSENYLSI